MIDIDQTLGTLAAESRTHLEVLEALELDYCCGGTQTLAQACTKRGLDAGTVAALLEGLDHSTHM
ncbi:MAG TPA: DUF542 domain-containing protein [Solirubrobacteraceae bacterium]|nr:DUF542 domain-containing protein [Solirubrobacteraceae bacterium]